eukprot:Hpha_TRINITY_DN22603_c0_g1::TRINITY_DN22603_c0_g1_i1::g.192799::m.192799
MPLLSIRHLSISFSVALVVIAGGGVGYLSWRLGDEAVKQTKGTWKDGLDSMMSVCRTGFDQLEHACSEGINTSLHSGSSIAEDLSQQVMQRTLKQLHSQIIGWTGYPLHSTGMLHEFFHSMKDSPERWVDHAFWESAIYPLARSLYMSGFERGVRTLWIRAWEEPGEGGALMHNPSLEESVIWTIYDQESLESGGTPFETIEKLYFDCDPSYSKQRCAENACVWCTRGGEGYCAHPLRKKPGTAGPGGGGGEPQICAEGWSLPPGYEHEWYSTTELPYSIGFTREDGKQYAGSCGFDFDCGCRAEQDYRMKNGSGVHLDLRGSYMRPDGTYPEPGETPKEEVMEPGRCQVPPVLVGVSRFVALLASRKYGDQAVHWAPVGTETISPMLNLNAYVTDHICKSPSECYQYHISVGIDVRDVSMFLNNAVRDITDEGYGHLTRLYAVQRDSARAAGPCVDDFYHQLEKLNSPHITCPTLPVIAEVFDKKNDPCDFDLFRLSPWIGRGTLVRDLCPETCGVCENGSFPLHLVEGIMAGASHGEPLRKLPLNESSLGFKNVSDLSLLHSKDSSDPIIREHARWVLSHGGFAVYPRLADWEYE